MSVVLFLIAGFLAAVTTWAITTAIDDWGIATFGAWGWLAVAVAIGVVVGLASGTVLGRLAR